MIANVALVVASLFAGWVALRPAARRLGAWGYHLAAFPIGLLAWPLAAAIADATGALFGAKTAALALVVLAVAGAALAWAFARGERGGERVPAWTYGAWGVGVLAAALLFARIGATAGAYDSMFHYHSWGIWLRDTGRVTAWIAGSYDYLLPSMHAGTLALGGDWTYVVYPVIALHTLALLGYATWRTLAGLPSRPRLACVAGAVALLATTSPFLFNALYVHSNGVSAMYLLLAVVALGGAFGLDAEEPAAAWGLVAGCAAAGLGLARTDGLAYAFVIFGAAAVLHLRKPSLRAFAAVLVGYLATLGAVYAEALWRLGLWESRKMDGRTALAMLAATVAFFALAALLARLRAMRPLALGSRAFLAAGALQAAAVVALAATRPERFAKAVGAMAGNLFVVGGHGWLWYVLAGVVAVAVAFRSSWRRDGWETPALVAFVAWQFAAVALVVHGVKHPGRLSTADSFNRAAFHIVPVLFWFATAVTGGLVRTLLLSSEAGVTGVDAAATDAAEDAAASC